MLKILIYITALLMSLMALATLAGLAIVPLAFLVLLADRYINKGSK